MKKTVGGIALALLLAACNGGGGSGSGGSDEDPQTLNLPPLDLEQVLELTLERVNQGGSTTFGDRTALAFENPAVNLSASDLARHLEGDRSFGAVFVSPPAVENPGLGPLFSNTSCEGCHTKNGRGQPIFGTGGLGSQAVLKVSSSSGVEELPGGPKRFGDLGTQLQDHATFGVAPEGTITIDYEYSVSQYGDGTPYELRKPSVSVVLADGSRLPSTAEISLRVPPPIFGLGLLEAIPASAILANADADDLNGDGISGRPNYVWDVASAGAALGRFGRKANNSTLLQQAASAYAGDIGVSNSLFPGSDGSSEISDDTMTSAEFYTQTLAVPAAGNPADPAIRSGAKLFVAFKCSNCHTPEFRTAAHPVHAVSNQRIFPYTDLLLHDMGAGLADNRSDFQASGREWRTPPLWGIGITATILSNTANFLHDGRARTLEEAILWHAGEGLESRERFRQSSSVDREALIQFLRSL